MTRRGVLSFLVSDVALSIGVVLVAVSVMAVILDQTITEAAGYGIGLLAARFVNWPKWALSAYRRRRPKADGVPDEDYDLVHYQPFSKRKASK